MNEPLLDAWKSYAEHAVLELGRARRRPSGEYPHYSENGGWVLVDGHQLSSSSGGVYEHGNWTAGFAVGKMWLGDIDQSQSVQATHREDIEQHVQYLSSRSTDHTTHDLGFIFYPAVVLPQLAGITMPKALVDAALEAAETLARRYNPRGGFLQAFGAIGATPWAGTSTIDTMMNLPLLWWASRMDADRGPLLRDIARTHARNAARLILRPDGSTFQLLHFDPLTGAVLRSGTFQGAASESTWSRGQAWAIAGLSWAYAEYGETEMLLSAERACDFFWAHLPADGVPPWDFADKGDSVAEDASASAIAALGSLILGRYHPEPERRRVHDERARSLLNALAESAMFEAADDSGILQRPSYSVPHRKGLSGATPWGDFYFGLALGLATGTIPWKVLGDMTQPSGEVTE